MAKRKQRKDESDADYELVDERIVDEPEIELKLEPETAKELKVEREAEVEMPADEPQPEPVIIASGPAVYLNNPDDYFLKRRSLLEHPGLMDQRR